MVDRKEREESKKTREKENRRKYKKKCELKVVSFPNLRKNHKNM